jgi:hypothetical protein
VSALERFSADGWVADEDPIAAELEGAAQPLFAAAGEARARIPVGADGPFGPALLGSPATLAFVRALLGDDCVVAALSAVVEPAGAPLGPMERAHPPLYAGLDLPCHAVVRRIPLGGGDPRIEVVAGSHRPPFGGGALQAVAGGSLLCDQRLLFRRTAHPGGAPRATLEVVYARPWFFDAVGFAGAPPLVMARATYLAAPPSLRPLLLRVGSVLARR